MIRFVAGLLECKPWNPVTSTAIGVVRGGDLVAGCVYSDFRWPNIELHLASTTPRWASKRVITALLAYPLRQLQCERVTAVTRASNHRIHRFLEGVGFSHEGVLREAMPAPGGTEDAHVYGLLRREWEESRFYG